MYSVEKLSQISKKMEMNCIQADIPLFGHFNSEITCVFSARAVLKWARATTPNVISQEIWIESHWMDTQPKIGMDSYEMPMHQTWH